MTPIRPGGKSAPSLSLAPPLDSQDVSRFQAVNTSPDYWGEKAPSLPWRWVAPLVVVGFLVGLSIVGAFAIDWNRAGKLAVAIPVVVVALVVLKRFR
jgi:hypothetical protein